MLKFNEYSPFKVQFLLCCQSKPSRLLGITVNIMDTSCYFLNVYMPYQCDDNYDLYVEYIGKISSLIEDSVTSNLIVLGDFNAAVNTLFESELVNMLIY